MNRGNELRKVGAANVKLRLPFTDFRNEVISSFLFEK